MNDQFPRVAVCAECRGLAEPPLTRVYDPYGLPTHHVVCLDCREQITRPDDPDELGGESG